MYKVPMLFPGQASQYVGMARDLAEGSGPAAAFLGRVDDILGYDLTRIMFAGPAAELTETRNAQPAILAHSVAVVLTLRELGVVPSVVAGHSLGEFSAAIAAGALEAAAGLRLVRQRGELMFAAGQERPGTMAAVMGLAADEVQTVCREVAADGGVVCLANHNSPQQVVISGEIEAVAAAGERLRTAGAKRVVPLQVSGAFHSPLLEEAAASFAGNLAEVELNDPLVPLVANVSGRAVTSAVDLKNGMAQQLTAPVLWHDSLETMLAADGRGRRPRVVLEVGPGRVLASLARRTFPEVTFVAVGSAEQLNNVLDSLQDKLT